MSWRRELLEMVDVIDMLESAANVRNLNIAGDEANFSCPFPGHSFGDTHPSAYMNLNTRLWFCHGCKESGDAITFLSKLENVPTMTVVRWYEERYGGSFKEPSGLLINEINQLINPDAPASTAPVDTPLSKRELDSRRIDWEAAAGAKEAPPPIKYMFDRGFDATTLCELAIGYDSLSSRITVPLHNVRGELVGFKGRSWHPEQEPRYVVLGDTPRRMLTNATPFGFAPPVWSRHLYLLDIAKPVDDTLVVIEGELNVVAMRQMGFDNVVGSGSTLSAEQISLLRDRCRQVVMFWDDDNAGREGLARVTPVLERYLIVKVVEPHAHDPASMLQMGASRSDVAQLIERAATPLERMLLNIGT